MNVRRMAIFSASLIGLLGLALSLSPLNEGSTAKAAETLPVLDISVPTDRPAEVYHGSFFYTTSQAMLTALDVKVYPEDKVVAFPDPALGIGSTISVYRAQSVTIVDNGEEKVVRTWAHTVGEVLAEQRVATSDRDIVQPSKQDAITLSDQIEKLQITRVSEEDVVVSEAVDYTVQTKEDATLEKGTKKTEQEGKDGVREKTYHVRRENGVVISKVLTSTDLVKPPTARIVVVGTKVTNLGQGQASWYGGVPALTAAHRSLPFGTKVRVTNLDNGKSVVVTISDRGPFIAGRIIDLSTDSFSQIASLGSGVANVRIDQE
jgi:hypothetical protein